MPRSTARFACFLCLALLVAVTLSHEQARPAPRLGSLPARLRAEASTTVALVPPQPAALAAAPASPSPTTPAPAPAAAPPQVATPAAPPTATPLPTPVPTPLVPANRTASARLADLPTPTGITPARLQIDAVGLNADLITTGFLPGTTELAVPDSPTVAGWYGGGTVPGEPGTALIAGHVDLASGARGPFFRLGQVKPEMKITLTFSDGSRRDFIVVARESYPQDALPADRILAGQAEPLLALITCGGRFDRQAGRYTENVVVYARPAA
jgi:hypothetical protein